MTAPLVVSTECPTCGAPLDFSEGSNAVHCVHCRSALLATGRKQVLSYVIQPRVQAAGAESVVKFASSGGATAASLTRLGLYFVPYYRLRAEDLRWEREIPERRPPDFAVLNDLNMRDALALARREEEPEPIVVLRERRIEKNFLGCTLPAVPVYSLGVRPSVLKLQLFDRAALEARGTIVATDVDAAAALERGLRTEQREKILHREVIGRVLSLIYFPYWVAMLGAGERARVAIVDGVTETLVARDVDAAVLATLDRVETVASRTVGFRPLACPNCGWELPLAPDDVIFPCGSCARAWLLEGDRLADLRFTVASHPQGEGAKPGRHLPIWEIDGASGVGADAPHGPQRCYVPAFRCRRLKLVHDLARNLTRVAPCFDPATGERPSLNGGYIDADDARALADFVRAGETAVDGELHAPPPISVTAARLTWLPFDSDGYSLREPVTGTSIPENLLM